MSCLNFGTWNATGIMSSASYVSHLLSSGNIQFFGLSEHWLYKHNLHFISTLSSEYNSIGVCDFDLNRPSSRKVGKGGVAIFWHRSLDNLVIPLETDSDRICGIHYTFNQHLQFYILQVYAPPSSHSIQVYKDFIDYLHVCISMYSQTGLVIVMGDFNAHLQGERFIKNTDVRGKYLLDMMKYHNLVSVNTLPICTGATASFVSYGDLYESLIDHILLPRERLDTVLSCEILDDDVLNVSRHRPVVCRVSVPLANFTNNYCSFTSHVKWSKLDECILQLYKSELNNAFSSDTFPEHPDPRMRLDYTYLKIINSITTVSDRILPKTKFRPYLKPYWDRNLKDLHAAMREKRRKWIIEGRPRGLNFSTYKDYKNAKRLFRAQHPKCAEAFLTELNLEIDQAAELDSAVFWKKVNSRRKLSHINAGAEIKFGSNVCRDPKEIAKGWGHYFRDLYSDTERSHYDARFKHEVDQKVQNIMTEIKSSRDRDPAFISVDNVRTAVKLLKGKKACGPDCIYNEHLINGGSMLYKQLAIFFTDMYNYGYIPARLKQGIIITLHKGGRKSIIVPLRCHQLY